jgi:hypothetical protein
MLEERDEISAADDMPRIMADRSGASPGDAADRR